MISTGSWSRSPGRPRVAPAWTKDLVFYQVAAKGFTSPRGAESRWRWTYGVTVIVRVADAPALNVAFPP